MLDQQQLLQQRGGYPTAMIIKEEPARGRVAGTLTSAPSAGDIVTEPKPAQRLPEPGPRSIEETLTSLNPSPRKAPP